MINLEISTKLGSKTCQHYTTEDIYHPKHKCALFTIAAVGPHGLFYETGISSFNLQQNLCELLSQMILFPRTGDTHNRTLSH